MASSPTLRELFETALKLSGEARTQLLNERCFDPHTRADVEQLLAADALDDDLPGAGDAAIAARTIGDPDAATMLPPASNVGPFELIEVLGQGGCSTVYRAFREEQGVRQEVALKLLSKGLYSSEAKHQFRREREALARLRDPGIARLIEGGITDGGLAYIALELVDGVPVTCYVQEQTLSVRARLGLFLTICRVVESAHRALIVHRDLKPSNVLVTAHGEVKLLDFGIAQLLDEQPDSVSRSPLHALTPAYAAPEQFAQKPVTTAADVYALGILLDELLGGQRTCGRDPLEPAATQAPTANAPQRPHSELDHIVRKASAFDPLHRYPSAGALADDIKRYLSRKPVLAHPHSQRYRLGKFALRYRAGLATTSAFVLAIFLALGAAVWQAGVAREQAARANGVRDFLVSVFQSAGADLPRDQRATPQDLVAQASKRLMTEGDLPDAQRADLILAVAKVARSVGSDAQALALLDCGALIIDRLYGPGDERWWDARVLRAAVLEDQARDSDVIRLLAPLRTTLGLRRDSIGIDGSRVLGNALLHSGQVDQGLALLVIARETARDAGLRDAQLSASIDEATALLDAEHVHGGLARAEAAQALWQSGGKRVDPRIVDLYAAIARGSEAAGDTVRAENAYRQAIAIGERVFSTPNRQQTWNLSMYGSFLIAQDRFVQAEPYAVHALELSQSLFGKDDSRTLYAISAMGTLRYGQGHYKQAVAWYAQGVASCRRTSMQKRVCARLLGLRGLAWTAAGRLDKAATDIGDALEAQRGLDGDNHPDYAFVLQQLASLQLARHEYLQTVATTDRVLAIYRRARGGMILPQLSTRLSRAQALFALGQNEQALQEVLDIEAKYRATSPEGNARFGILALKARALLHAHRDQEAAASARDALHVQRLRSNVDPQLVVELTHIAFAGQSAPRR